MCSLGGFGGEVFCWFVWPSRASCLTLGMGLTSHGFRTSTLPIEAPSSPLNYIYSYSLSFIVGVLSGYTSLDFHSPGVPTLFFLSTTSISFQVFIFWGIFLSFIFPILLLSFKVWILYFYILFLVAALMFVFSERITVSLPQLQVLYLWI